MPRKQLTDKQGGLALEGFLQLELTRYPADWLRPRMWTLRHTITAYDATYLALAESTGASALLTTDGHLAEAAAAAGVTCSVLVV